MRRKADTSRRQGPESRHRSVAIIVAAYNAERTIGRAIKSALGELETGEVLVVDDASSDRTFEQARLADDGTGRLRLKRLPQNLGPSAARNLALAQTQMPFVTVLDSDDYFLPGRLAQLVGAAADWDFIADDLLRKIDGEREGRYRRLVGASLDGTRAIDFEDFVRKNVSRPGSARRELGFLKPLVRRSFLERTGLAYDERLRFGEDFIYYASALAAGARFRLMPACGYVSTERPGSLSHDHSISDLLALGRAAEELTGRLTDPGQVQAMDVYRDHLARKTHYREILALRRDAGLWAALGQVRLRHASYVISQSLRARFSRLAPARVS